MAQKKLEDRDDLIKEKFVAKEAKIADLESLLRRMLPRLEPAKYLPPNEGDALPSSPADSEVDQVEHSAEGQPIQPGYVPDDPSQTPIQADSKNEERPVEQE